MINKFNCTLIDLDISCGMSDLNLTLSANYRIHTIGVKCFSHQLNECSDKKLHCSYCNCWLVFWAMKNSKRPFSPFVDTEWGSKLRKPFFFCIYAFKLEQFVCVRVIVWIAINWKIVYLNLENIKRDDDNFWIIFARIKSYGFIGCITKSTQKEN